MAQGEHDNAALLAELATLRSRVAELESSERQLRQSEFHLQAIAESSTDYIMLIDRDAVIQYINRALDEFEIRDVIGTSILDYVSEHDARVMSACFQRVLATGQPDRYTTMYERSGGEFLEFEARVAPLVRDGGIVAMTVSSSNMTERRRALVERDQFFHLSIDMFCIATRDARFKSVSPAFRRTLGYAEGDLLGKPMIRFTHPDDISEVGEVLGLLSGGDEHIEFENRFRCADESYKWLSWRAVVDADLDLVYAVARDVTERRELENQLRQSQKMEAVGQLAGGIAHDFNNLITAILLNAQRAQRDVETSGPQYRRLEDIVDTCQRCSALTNKLLTFSRTTVLSHRTLDISALVAEIGGLVERVLPENIEFTLNSSGGLPPIRGDATQIEQIVVNLCVNARDAMPDGGRIELDVREVVLGQDECDGHPWVTPGRFVQLSVTDTGMGMSTEVQERAFEPFFTTKQPGEGTGLGLATVYGIVKQHEGLIKLISEPGQGTRCEIYVPVSKRGRATSSPAIRIPAVGGSETLLVAEDESSLRAILVEILRESGYRVFVASHGKEAVAVFQEHADEIDLVVLDMIMPQMSGVEAYEWISNVRANMPVLFCSGYSQFELKRVKERDPVSRLLTKPYDIQDVLSSIRKVLDAHKQS